MRASSSTPTSAGGACVALQLPLVLLVVVLLSSASLPLLVTSQPSPSDPSISTRMSRCYGPTTLPSGDRIPLICAEVGFAQCASFALNFTVSSDGVVLVSEELPSPLDFKYPYDLGGACVAEFALKKATAVITPTYIHVQPTMTVTCGGYPISTQDLDWITLGADCEALACDTCNANSLCGWCSEESDFLTNHDVADWTTFQQLNTHGRCIGRGPNSTPWCSTCALTYNVGPASCPVYTGGAAGGGGGGGGAGGETGTGTAPESSGGFLGGNKTYQIIFGVFIVLVCAMGGVIVWLCMKRRAAGAAATTARYSKSVEMRGGGEGVLSSPTNNFTRLTDADSASGYIPPTTSLNSDYAPVVPSAADQL